MTGRAVITDKNDGQFGYREQGQLRLSDGRLIDAERCYIFAEDAAGFRVLFSESPPRLFHRIALSRVGPNLIGDGIHLCGDDRYDSRYEFRVDGSFIVRHGVVGPRKRYTIETRYCRQA